MNQEEIKKLAEELSAKYGDAVHMAMEEVKTLRKVKVVKPRKPMLAAQHTHDDILKYADSIKAYEKELATYNKEAHSIHKYNDFLKDALYEYFKLASGFYETVPQQYQAKVWAKAISDYDYYPDVYNELTSLVEIFE